MVDRHFDLNVEKVLQDWKVSYAIREVIANALDEHALTETEEPRIHREGDVTHIRDYGRGLRYDHLTQNEDLEKLANPEKVVGKFGVGLKDAIATFHRRNVDVTIHSKHNTLTFRMSRKHGFEDVVTLHARVSDPVHPTMDGTEVVLSGVEKSQVEEAKSYFLKYSGDQILARTRYGEILDHEGKTARIYVNGLRVAEEENFLLSYNITSPTAQIRRALNRERTNVGRAAYSGRVKDILVAQENPEVARKLVEDLQKFETGGIHDELAWTDVSAHACGLLNASDRVIFLTPEELTAQRMLLNEARMSGIALVVIPESVRSKLLGQFDAEGHPIRDLEVFAKEYKESFRFQLVDPGELSKDESRVFGKTDAILDLVGGRPAVVKDIVISETMRISTTLLREAGGVWDPPRGRIIIKRDQLRALESFAGTLLHEVAHALGGPDISEQFEGELTRLLGVITGHVLT